jgi:superfamily II RNA helicase
MDAEGSSTPVLFTMSFPFPLDEFQLRAVEALDKGDNVLVTAKTGSGKTFVGEYQIKRSLSKGKRVFYTTPIKSLTNQKFHDLKKVHPSVGIMTGDIKFAPQSDIVILTTEILRNLLYKQGGATESVGITAHLSLTDVDAIVFDEVHYINDPARGKVWEECFILLPPTIQLVLLSATIDKPEAFASWLSNLKCVKTHLISTTYRVVPLFHKVGNELVMGNDGTFNRQVYDAHLRSLKNKKDDIRKHTEAVRAREKGQEVVERPTREASFLQQMNDHIAMLQNETLLPALYFVFSRKNCVHYANRVTHDLIDSSESAAVKHIVNFHLHRYPELKTLPQFHDLERLLYKGIAYHHSGLLPVLKEIVEILFGRGYIKLLFATETFAVGINMPTKTVVFTSYRKFDDLSNGMRMLRTDEYIQMAGRAGRRGKDDKGIVYYLPDRDPESAYDVETMMTGRQATITSQMDFGYEFILKSLVSDRLEWKEILHSSYWYQQQQEQLRGLIRERDTLEASLPPTDPECEVRWNLEITFKTSVNAAKKAAQRELESWKNRHPGPKWEALWAAYQIRASAEARLVSLDDAIADTRAVTKPVEDRIQYLTEKGYIHDGRLTKLGQMAAEINEGDPLVMSRMFQDKVLHAYTGKELVAELSKFLEKEKEFDWCDPIYEWMEDGDFGELCVRYGMDAGTFMKAILKTANILEEWTVLATMCEDLAMLETLRGLKEQLVRGIVVPDSLYLRV